MTGQDHRGDFQLRAATSLSGKLYFRLDGVRRRLEKRYHMRIEEAALLDYLFEKAIERLEEWEDRQRRCPG